MPRSYNTKQKDEIIAAVRERGDGHFTAEEICLSLKENGVGLSTVYRHLDRLVKDGVLRKYVSGAGESACYQLLGGCGEHFHLKCVVCGKLEHLSCSHLDGIRHHVLEEHGFSVDPGRTVFYGVCAACKEK